MKKLTYFLLIAFSFVFVFSCNTEEDKPITTKPKITELTAEQKVALLNNYEWLEERDNINNPRCSSQDKLIFNAVSILGDVFNGNYTSYKYKDTDGGMCLKYEESGDYRYSTATNKIRIDHRYTNSLEIPVVSSIVGFTVNVTTIKLGDKTLKKGALRKK